MKRRQFLGTGAALSAAVLTPRMLFALDKDNAYRNAIGIQLYTLRNQIQDDAAGTIKAVAEAGYKQVEPFGFPDAQPMIDAARDNGLAINSTHFAWDSVVNPDDKGVTPFSKILEKANEVGLTHLVIPYLDNNNRKNLDDYKLLAERCNKSADVIKCQNPRDELLEVQFIFKNPH